MANYLVFLGLSVLICRTGVCIKPTLFLRVHVVRVFEIDKERKLSSLGSKCSVIQGSYFDHRYHTCGREINFLYTSRVWGLV